MADPTKQRRRNKSGAQETRKPQTTSRAKGRSAKNRPEQRLIVDDDEVRLDAMTAVESAMEGISKLDDAGRYVFVNQKYATLFGYRPDELVGQSWDMMVHPDDRSLFQTGLTRMCEEGKGETELRGLRKDGSVIVKHVVLVKHDRSGKNSPGYFCFAWDMTEPSRIAALHDAEKRALELVAKGDSLESVLAFICTAVERLASPMLCSVMLTDDEGTHLSLATAPNLPNDYNRAIARIPIGPAIGSCGSAAYFQKPVIAADIAVDPSWKDYVSVALTYGLKACWSLPIIGSASKLLGTLAVYHSEPRAPQPTDLKILERVSQITAIAIEHARMTEALREGEARFQAFMRHSPAITFIRDAEGQQLYVNPQFETTFNLSRQSVQAKTLFDFMPADIATRLAQNDRRVLDSGQALETEEYIPVAGGEVRCWLVSKFPLNMPHKRLLGGVAVDITERKAFERAARDQAERLRLAMDIARLATWDWDILTNEVIWSENCEEVKGLPRGSFDRTFETYQQLVHPEDRPRLLADIQAALDGQQSYHTEHRIVPPTGEVQWVEGNGVVYRDELGRPIRMVGTVRNITEQKRMEQALRVKEDRYARATAVGRVGVWELDVQAGTFYGDPNLKLMYGFQLDEITTDPVVWLNLLHPDDQSIALAHWQRIVSREADAYQYEARMVRKDGSVIWVEIRGRAVRDGVGALTHLIGATHDITDRKEAEGSLLRTQFAMDQAVDAVYWIDPQARILYTNEAATVMLGYTADEFLRMTVHDLNPDFPAEVWPGWWKEVKEKKVVSLETNHLTKDGRRIPIDIRVAFLAHGGHEFHCAFVRDISERKRTDEALRESQERFELAARASNDGIWDWNILTGEQYWSDRHHELFGIKPGELAPTYDTWISMLHPDDAALVREATRRHLETRAPYDIEARVRMKNGSYRWFRDQGQAVWNELGRPVRMVGTISDVTKYRQAEEAIWKANSELEQRVLERTKELARSNRALELEVVERRRVETRLERTQYAVNHAADQIFVIDSKGKFLDVNESACRRLGYTKEELLTMSVMEIDPDFPPEAWDPCWAAVTREGRLRIETRHRSKSGEIYPVEVVANYLCHNGQELDCAFVRDISERKRIEDRLQRTQYAVDHAADQIFVIGSNGYFLDVNESACRRLGYRKEELLTLSVMDIDSDCSVELWIKVWAEFIEKKGMRLDRYHRSKVGEVYPVEVLANYIHHQGQDLSYAIVRDVSERHQAEAAIRESELRYKLVTEATFDAIAIHDQGVLLEVNPGLERMFGYEPGELLGRSIVDLVAQESREQVIINMRDSVMGPYEAIGRRKDGTTFPGELVVRPYWYQGREVRLVAGRDITERKRLEMQLARHAEELERQVAERTAEVAKLEAQRTQTEKLAAVGQMAAAVAHEINNPIAGIRNAFTLVKQAVNPAHPHYEFVGMIDREIARVASIVQNMYQLYRKEPSKAEPVNLSLILRDLEALFAKRLSQLGMMMVVTETPLTVQLLVPQSDLLQVLMNLIQNALDSSPQGRTIRLHVMQTDDCIRISVSDEGNGIPSDVLPHIFDPFFTTKTEKGQKGMGLGLSVSQSLVMAMGGRIEVQTEQGVGSTFAIILPVPAGGDRSVQQNIIQEVLTHET